jgi:hypothetical protein
VAFDTLIEVLKYMVFGSVVLKMDVGHEALNPEHVVPVSAAPEPEEEGITSPTHSWSVSAQSFNFSIKSSFEDESRDSGSSGVVEGSASAKLATATSTPGGYLRVGNAYGLSIGSPELGLPASGPPASGSPASGTGPAGSISGGTSTSGTTMSIGDRGLRARNDSS